jgi:flagellar biosynthesis protein FlhF
MNVKRFIARSSREALNQVRMAFGAEAVVLSNRPCEHGVEVLAMAPGAIAQIEKVAETATPHETPSIASPATPKRGAQQPAQPNTPVEQDVQSLAMSTLSFQDYVRERLLRRRRAAMQPDPPETVMPTYEERAPAAACARQRTAERTVGERADGLPAGRDSRPGRSPRARRRLRPRGRSRNRWRRCRRQRRCARSRCRDCRPPLRCRSRCRARRCACPSRCRRWPTRARRSTNRPP